MISLQMHYRERGAGTSKTAWSEWGSDFARYARKVVALTGGRPCMGASPSAAPPSDAPADDTAMRLATLEATLAQQNELIRRLVANQPSPPPARETTS